MKKINFLLLFAIIFTFPVILTSCGDDEPTPSQTKLDDLYGYWINTDNSCAMNIVKYLPNSCKILSYTYSEKLPQKIDECESYYSPGGSFYIIGSLDELINDCHLVYVKISSSSYNRMVLVNDEYAWENDFGYVLSSYIFNRVDEDTFYEYLANGGKNDSNVDAEKLIGTWVGYDGDEKYTITFYSSGSVKEVWTDGDDTETMNGTYKYSNGKITSWNVDGSILENVIGECPWPVNFNSATSMTLGSGYNKMTFTKK